ncbi:DUF2483 family protein [Staphylococcus gallinarum]|uniref:DUF2483 family protein n=1 Tax=Staphylococcus gallinarum TaxID=1293 RepID=UPI001E2FFD65|nr:DUF2483 family protein [Staphylococcus gallinarum]
MTKEKTMQRKQFYRIVHKSANHFVDNRPTKRAPTVEYTSDEESSKRFIEDDFDIIDIDWEEHELIECETTRIKIDRKRRVSFSDRKNTI